MSSPEIKISIIIPVYNESKNIQILHNEITESLPSLLIVKYYLLMTIAMMIVKYI